MLKLVLWARPRRSELRIAAGTAVVLALACAASAIALVAGARAAAVSKVAVVVTNTSEKVNGHVSSIAALNAHPGRDGVSLREALEAVDNTRGNATVYIMFSHALNGKTIWPRSKLPPISRNHVVLEGIAPNGAPTQVTINGGSEKTPVLSDQLLLVQASEVTVRWLRLVGENPQGSSRGVMRALTVSAGVPPGGMKAGPPTIRNVRILDDVFDGHRVKPGVGPGVALVIGGGGLGCCVGTYRDITIAGNTFVDQAVDGEGVEVTAPNRGMSMSGVVIEDNTIHDDIAIELALGGIATRLTGTQIVGNTITGSGGPTGSGGDKIVPVDFTMSNIGPSTATNATTDNTLIEDNTIWGGIGFGNGGTGGGNVISNTQIVNNVIVHNFGGITIRAGGERPSLPGNVVSGVTIENDTLIDTSTSAASYLLSESASSTSDRITGVVVRNTLFYDPAGQPIQQTSAPVPLQAPDSLVTSLLWGTGGNTSADPGFVDLAGGDYHLTAGSPAINAGTTIAAPTDDFDGALRDSAPDIGAFEYGAAPRPLLTVSVVPLGGSGTVMSAPSGLACDTECGARFALSAPVALTAKPVKGSRFLRWQGACAGTRRCVVTLTGGKSVTARFGAK